jgi:hypothetical protein
MIIRTTTKRLAILAFHFFDGQIVDASKTPGHKTVAVKFPILVPVGSKPVATIIVPFVSKADCNSIFMKSPELLNESIVQFPSPLMGEKLDNCLTAGEKLQTITPYAVRSVGAGHVIRIATVPSILRQSDFLHCRVTIEGRNRKTFIFESLGDLATF